MKQYNRKQEVINGLIHGVGILFGVAALPILTGLATSHHNTAGIIGAGVYGFCFLQLFSCSLIYHLVQETAIKKAFKIFDHISIYFLISGTYTPFLLIFVNNRFGITLLSVLWGLTLLGIFFKIWFTGRFEIISVIIYILMGWIMFVGGRRFFEHLPFPVLLFISIGAVLYSTGVIFYVRDRHFYSHAIWHTFVLLAAVCHYVAVLLSM